MRTVTALALLLLSASAARAEEAPPLVIASPWTAAVSAGYGIAYDGVGIALELRRGDFAASLGLGSDAFGSPPDSGPRGRSQGSLALGARWFSGDGEGALLGVHASAASWDGWQTHAVGMQGRALFGASAGWRLRFGQTFVEAALGAAGRYEKYDVQLASAQPHEGWSLVPDVTVGAGLQF